MKNIFKFLLIVIVAINCKAQTFNIEGFNGDPITGAYYKDINNIFDPFVGTWLYTNGNQSFKIILKKMNHSSMGDVYYEDLLVGEYENKINNIVKVSTISSINNNYTNGSNHNITANSILRGGTRACRSCPTTDVFINGGMIETVGVTTSNLSPFDPNNPHTYYGEIFMKRIVVNGQAALEFTFYWRSSFVQKGYPKPQSPSLTAGTYIMIKQ